MKSKNRTSNSFAYMTANFIAASELAAVAGSSLLGGSIYGGAYAGTKHLMGENLSPEDYNKEIAANTGAGVASGLGGYLITKAMRRRLG